ncbi:heme-binding protein [Lentzea sp. HUAS12]|uniref:GlcG/HbpS family heme-binding protein n=1 Tax=Lentzea sp. HUAS12 TaxID=2951806 RepID=UPI00209D43C8|nr:heme-binding protein [Lentzea sp. HUAS12]USX56089.1 heme-binding protein [Lentzea sp. HUAS12]
MASSPDETSVVVMDIKKIAIATLVVLSIGGGYAAADQRTTTRTEKVLTIDAAVRAAQATLDAAEKENQRVTVAVVDRSGDLVVLLAGDGAGPQTEESARRKAFTAVSFNAPTSELAGRVTGQGATLRDIPGTLFLGGGVPVAVDGTSVAGIGVGGAPSGDLDEKFAKAGLATLR